MPLNSASSLSISPIPKFSSKPGAAIPDRFPRPMSDFRGLVDLQDLASNNNCKPQHPTPIIKLFDPKTSAVPGGSVHRLCSFWLNMAFLARHVARVFSVYVFGEASVGTCSWTETRPGSWSSHSKSQATIVVPISQTVMSSFASLLPLSAAFFRICHASDT